MSNCYSIVPAAGRSQRMGSAKLLLPWGQSTVIETVLAAWRASRVANVIVVVHHDDHELAERARHAGASVVAPEVPPPDMRTSVLRGLEYLGREFAPAPTDAWLVAPADLPLLTATLIDRLIDAHVAEIAFGRESTILVPVRDGRRGHPVLFPWLFADKVQRLPANQGLNALVASCPTREIPCGGELAFDDVDTPEEYRRLYDRHNRTNDAE
jgi:molybdenum cofactor cytidylyltransferase